MAFWRKWYLRWLDRRLPATADVVLSQRRVFIFPSRFGIAMLLLALVIFIGGINYQNNLVMGFSFLLFALFCVAILHTFRNLSGLRVRVVGFTPNFVDMRGAVHLQLLAANKGHQALRVFWRGDTAVEVALMPQGDTTIRVPLLLQQRGWNRPLQRLIVESTYPLGLLRVWTTLNLAARCLAWPRPLAGGTCPVSGDGQRHGLISPTQGNEDFAGFKEYQSGDAPQRIDWKVYARGQGVKVRYFDDRQQGGWWLDWGQLPDGNIEARLSRLCYWGQQLEMTGQPWGLLLPGAEVPLGQGAAHLRRVLDSLASFRSGDGA